MALPQQRIDLRLQHQPRAGHLAQDRSGLQGVPPAEPLRQQATCERCALSFVCWRTGDANQGSSGERTDRTLGTRTGGLSGLDEYRVGETAQTTTSGMGGETERC